MTIRQLKQMTKEEFLKYPDATEYLYNALKESKEGYISIEKDGDPFTKEHGYTDAFGEGVSLYLSNAHRWYRTSTIKKINWEEKYFDTMNSRYHFDFVEYDPEREDSNIVESSKEI